jgi:hypothetical protein
MEGEEADHLLQSADDAGDLLIGVETGEAQARVIIDGDMERFNAGADAAVLAIAGSTHSWRFEAAELLDVEMDEFARGLAFVADDRRRGGVERLEQVDAVAFEDAPDGGLRHGNQHDDLGVGPALAAKTHHVALEARRGPAGLAYGHTGVFAHPFDDSFDSDAGGPASDGFLTDTAGGCCLPQCQSLLEVQYHLSSTPRGKLGISVHVVRAVGL